MAVQQPLSFSDLYGVGSSPDSVRQVFTDEFGKKPDGISVNSETYYDAVKPAITEQYGHPCYKRVGEITVVEGEPPAPREMVIASHDAINNGDQPATVGVEIEGTWTDSITASASVTTGATLTTEVELTGVWKLGGSFEISVTVGSEKTKETGRSASTSVEVEVPPHSKRRVDMVAFMQEEEVEFIAPVTVDGMFGANFPDRVREHYFWFLSASRVLPRTDGKLEGTVKRGFALNTQTVIHASEPI